LKPAAIADVWRSLRKSTKRPIRRLYVRWSGLPRLGDGDIQLVSPVTLICGENGAGKTSLLHAMVHAVVRESDVTENEEYCRPRTGRIESVQLDLASQDGSTTTIDGHEAIGAHFFPTGDSPRVAFVDAGMHVPAILDFVMYETNVEDYLEGVDPITFSDKELQSVGFIVGRNYSEILVYEVLDSSFSGLFPFFVVRSHGVRYDTRDMGYGEIAVIYLTWVLRRLVVGGLVLIEEPETFLSPRAQTALVDVIAAYALSKGLVVAMTSHSGAIGERMRNDEIVYVTRSSGRVNLQSPAHTSDLVARLGMRRDRAFVAFVEDQAAEIFARVLIDRHSTLLAGSVEFSQCGGESNVLRAIEALPSNLRNVAHVGILDGDQRNTYRAGDPRIVFLPGDSPPEVVLQVHARSKSEDELADLFARPRADIARANAHADGDDLHNWFHTFGRTLHIPYGEVVRRLVESWAASNQGDAAVFVNSIEAFSAVRN
jgi:hypothetical protein